MVKGAANHHPWAKTYATLSLYASFGVLNGLGQEPLDVRATFNPQFQIGKNTYSWTVETCNYTEVLQTYDGTMIAQVGEMTGNLLRVSSAEAETEANAWRNKTLPVEGADATHQLAQWITIVGASGVFAISKHGLAWLALSAALAEQLSGWLQKKESASFLTRFPPKTWLEGPVDLPPRGCVQDRVLFSKRVKRAHAFSIKLP